MKHAAIYIRVSTVEQAKEGYSIAAQRNRLINYCSAKNWVIQDVYVDDGYTGTNIDRPALKSMLNNLNNIDIVLVYKLDRLSRSQKDVLYLVEEKFLKNDIDFVSLLESFDTSTPFGRAMLGILAVFAQLERDTIVERVKLGKEERAKEGFWKGGGNTPIGYDYIEGNLVINEYQAEQIRYIYSLYIEGYGYHIISNKLVEMGYKVYGKNWSSSLIRQVLLNKTYAGYIKHHDTYYPAVHHPIISEEIFEKAQSIRNKRKSSGTAKARYLLSSLLYCGYCGAKMKGMWTINSSGQKYEYYLCYSRSGVKHMIKNPNCPSCYWTVDQLNNEIEKQILNLTLNKDIYYKVYRLKNKTIDDVQDKIKSIELQLINLDKQIDKLINLYQHDNIAYDKISKKIDKLYNEKSGLIKSLDCLKSKTESNNEYTFYDTLDYLNNFKLIWDNAHLDEKQRMLRILVNKIVVTDKVDIKFNVSNLT